jgi:hypothetical protein
VVLRKPIGILGPQVLGVHAVADEEGVIIGQSDKSNLPLLIDNISIKPGDKLPPGQLTALKILGQLSRLSSGPVIGKISGSDLTAFISENISVLIDPSHLLPNWHATLQVILDRSKILNKMPKIIDLRFSSPIITF